MPRFDLSRSRVLLTGASSGIGYELALEMAGRGAVLALVARREDRLDRLARVIEQRHGVRPTVEVADLSVRGVAADVAERVTSRLGGVDVLVNNAGVGVSGNQWSVGDRQEARAAFEVNFWAPMALQQALVPAMRGRRHGAVVNITALAQVVTVPGLGHYSATKAALAIATETLRQELAGSGIHVLEVIAGPVETAVQVGLRELVPGARRALTLGPMGEPDELARRVVRALRRGRPLLVYPGFYSLAHRLPAAPRRLIVALSKRSNRHGEGVAEDPSVLSSDSQAARSVSERWERRRPL